MLADRCRGSTSKEACHCFSAKRGLDEICVDVTSVGNGYNTGGIPWLILASKGKAKTDRDCGNATYASRPKTLPAKMTSGDFRENHDIGGSVSYAEMEDDRDGRCGENVDGNKCAGGGFCGWQPPDSATKRSFCESGSSCGTNSVKHGGSGSGDGRFGSDGAMQSDKNIQHGSHGFAVDRLGDYGDSRTNTDLGSPTTPSVNKRSKVDCCASDDRQESRNKSPSSSRAFRNLVTAAEQAIGDHCDDEPTGVDAATNAISQRSCMHMSEAMLTLRANPRVRASSSPGTTVGSPPLRPFHGAEFVVKNFGDWLLSDRNILADSLRDEIGQQALQMDDWIHTGSTTTAATSSSSNRYRNAHNGPEREAGGLDCVRDITGESRYSVAEPMRVLSFTASPSSPQLAVEKEKKKSFQNGVNLWSPICLPPTPVSLSLCRSAHYTRPEISSWF